MIDQPGIVAGSGQPVAVAGATGATGPGILTVGVTITSAQILALRATPKELVAAPGAGQFLEFVGLVLFLDFGTLGYTEVAANLAVKYTDGSGVQVSQTIEATGFIDQLADTATVGIPKIDPIAAKAGCENKALVLHNLGAAEYLAGDGVIRAKCTYRVHATGW